MSTARWLPATALLLAGLTLGGLQCAQDRSLVVGLAELGLPVALAAPWLGLAALLAWRGQRRPLLAFASLLLPLALALSLRGASAPLPSPARLPPRAGPSLLLLTLDTFRADHLEHAPFLSSLEPLREAVTTAPLTAPAHASMLTGLSTAEHGLRANGRSTSAPSVVTELAAQGYRTGAFLGARVLASDTGLARGFQHYDDRFDRVQRLGWWGLPGVGPGPRERSGGEVVDRALRWARGQAGASFLWVHLYEAHAPYQVPARLQDIDALLKARTRDLQEAAPGEASRTWELRARYRDEIRLVDRLARRLVEGLPADTVVVVAGDHGESLGEHGYRFGHGARLWEPSLAVPLLTRGVELPERQGLWSVAQVAELLRFAAGLGPAPGPVGRVEVSTTGQQSSPQPELVRGPAAALRWPGGKLLQHPGEEPVFYDLLLDREELRPQPPSPWMGPELEAVDALLVQPVEESDPELLRRLEALGYVE